MGSRTLSKVTRCEQFVIHKCKSHMCNSAYRTDSLHMCHLACISAKSIYSFWSKIDGIFFSWKAFHILVRQSKLLKTSITRAWLHSRRAQVLIWPVCSQTFHQLITFTFYSIPSVLLLALLFPHIFKTFHFISKT